MSKRSEAQIIVAFLRLHAEQYRPSSESYEAFAAKIARGEHLLAMSRGELDGLLNEPLRQCDTLILENLKELYEKGLLTRDELCERLSQGGVDLTAAQKTFEDNPEVMVKLVGWARARARGALLAARARQTAMEDMAQERQVLRARMREDETTVEDLEEALLEDILRMKGSSSDATDLIEAYLTLNYHRKGIRTAADLRAALLVCKGSLSEKSQALVEKHVPEVRSSESS